MVYEIQTTIRLMIETWMIVSYPCGIWLQHQLLMRMIQVGFPDCNRAGGSIGICHKMQGLPSQSVRG